MIEKYKNGVFGALPYPDLYDVLLVGISYDDSKGHSCVIESVKM